MRRILLIALAGFVTAGWSTANAAAAAGKARSGKAGKSAPWRALFNGKDLSGWDTWLGIPDTSVAGLDMPRNAARPRLR